MKRGILLSAVLGLALLATSGCGGGGGSAGDSGSIGGGGGGTISPSICPANPTLGTDRQLAGSALEGIVTLDEGIFLPQFIVFSIYQSRVISCTEGGNMSYNFDRQTNRITATFNGCRFTIGPYKYTISGSIDATIGQIDLGNCFYNMPYTYTQSMRIGKLEIKVADTSGKEVESIILENLSYGMRDVELDNTSCNLHRKHVYSSGSKVLNYEPEGYRMEVVVARNMTVTARRELKTNTETFTYDGQLYVNSGCVNACVDITTRTPEIWGSGECPQQGELTFSAGGRSVTVRYAQDGLYINNQKVSNSCVISACGQ